VKTSMFRTLATLSLSAALGSISLLAQAGGPIPVTVPFDFTIGSKSLAAGEYRVREQPQHVLAIHSVKGNAAMMVMTHAADPNAGPGQVQLTFNQYGDRYFLSQVSYSGRGWQLPQSRLEKELIAKRVSPKPVIVDADDQ
jgi:hypothetical protein